MIGFKIFDAQVIEFIRIGLIDIRLIIVDVLGSLGQGRELQEHVDMVARHAFDEIVLIECTLGPGPELHAVIA